jgi:hypothetical protein
VDNGDKKETPPHVYIEFDPQAGEFKQPQLNGRMPVDKLHFVLELVQMQLVGAQVQATIQAAQREQAKKPVMPGPHSGLHFPPGYK